MTLESWENHETIPNDRDMLRLDNSHEQEIRKLIVDDFALHNLDRLRLATPTRPRSSATCREPPC